jgi:hypothetical protein
MELKILHLMDPWREFDLWSVLELRLQYWWMVAALGISDEAAK